MSVAYLPQQISSTNIGQSTMPVRMVTVEEPDRQFSGVIAQQTGRGFQFPFQ